MMKAWYTSKTVWTNVALFIGGLAVIVGSTSSIPTNIALRIDTGLALAGAVVNLALRVFFTSTPILAAPQPPQP